MPRLHQRVAVVVVFTLLTVAAAVGQTVCPTSAPQITSPADGATNVSTQPTVSWTAVPNADSYDVYLASATAGGCNGQPIATTSTNSFAPPQLQPGTRYEWRVVPRKASCSNGPTSACVKFTTGGSACTQPGSFNLTAPQDSSTTAGTPTLTWTASQGAASYRLHIATTNPPLSTSDVTLDGQTTSYTPQNLTAGTTYYWQVDALPACGSPARSSNIAKFTVGGCPTTAPQLTTPAAGATNVKSPVDFSWSRVTGAVAYKLWIGTDASLDLAGLTTDTKLTRIVPAGAAFWFVDAVFGGDCPDQRSQTGRFTVAGASTCPTGTVTLTAPAANATVSSPVTLQWTGITGANAYRVYVAMNGSAPTQVTRTQQTTTTVTLPSGNAEWYVEALFSGDCDSIVSSHGTFKVAQAATCGSNVAPSTIAPAANTTTNATDVTFSWAAVPNATGYRLWIATRNQPFVDSGFVTATTLTRSLPTGAASWYVEAFFENCPSLTSAHVAFTVGGTNTRCSTTAPVTISPADKSPNAGSPVHFTWTPVPNAREYRLFVGAANGELQHIATTPDTSLDRAIPPGSYVWLVEATFGGGCSVTRSPRATFTVARSQNCGTAVPVLTTPADDASLKDPSVDYSWQPVPNATGYAVWARPPHGAPGILALTTDTHLTRRMPEGETEWWVVAIVAGCDPAESVHFGFDVATPQTCSTQKPSIVTPPAGAPPVVSPVRFAWTRVAKAVGYKVWASVGDDGPSVIGTSLNANLVAQVPSGTIHWFVEALFANCPSTQSATSTITVLPAAPPCGVPDRTLAHVAARAVTGTKYTLRWTSVPNVKLFEVEESTTPDFSVVTTQSVTGVSLDFNHATEGRYYYRVRGVSSCSDERGPYSDVVSVLVTRGANNAAVELGTQSAIVQSVFVPGPATPTTFTARGDKPWISVSPTSGTIGPNGLTFTVTSDPSTLQPGTNAGTVILTYGGAGKGLESNAGGLSIPLNLSLVTPVVPAPKDAPTPESLIIPAVAHAQGALSSLFESDIRISNLSPQTTRYLINFTPSNSDATQTGQSTTIEIPSGLTVAFDDVLATLFGLSPDVSQTGVLEIRPLTDTTSSGGALTGTTAAAQTIASSRTYNTTPNGTFGQYIPAVPFSQFIAQGAKLSLQQIAQSAAYRTNFGLVEGSGEPVSVVATVFSATNQNLGTFPFTLLPGEHRQLNSFLAANGIPSLADGRIEVAVTSPTGKVTTYASVVDNATNDPLLVSPVLTSTTTAGSRYVLPGVADINNGFASWRTDMRVFNPAATQTAATLTYYPQGSPGTPSTKDVTILPGQVYAIDNLLQSAFNLTNSGGSLLISTTTPSTLIATARTYNQTSNGTYGQFIPAVTPTDSATLGGKTLQLLQLESSNRYRTNIGLAETSGAPATVEVTVVPSDTTFESKIPYPLAANEFRQISLSDFNLGTLYNARVTVRVTSGAGKVTSYASVIDQTTQDPTYVPAQ